MSKQSEDHPQLDRCIVSRLWYTAATILRHRIDSPDQNPDLKTLAALIGSCAHQGLLEHRWIAYNILSQLESNDETKRILTQEEFVSTLKLLDTRIPHRTKEEMLTLFESVQSAERKNNGPAFQLSQESLECFETNLLENPALVHWIIKCLLCIWLPTHFAQTDCALQEAYFRSVEKLLQIDKDTVENEESLSSNKKRNRNRLGKRQLGVLLSILSKVSLTDSKEDEFLGWLFPALLNCCNSDDVELALYSRKDGKFFSAWHSFLDENFRRCDAPDNLEKATKISEILFDCDGDSRRHLNVEQVFKRTLSRQKHWLIDILDICYVLLINSRHAEVEKILGSPALNDLWLVMLFKLLNDAPNEPIYSSETSRRSSHIYSALKFTLKKSMSFNVEDPTLIRLEKTLNNHLEVLKWILDQKETEGISKTVKTSVIYPNLTLKQVLNLLNTQSVLSVLKSTTNLHESCFDEVSLLLKDSEDSRNVFLAYFAMLNALKAIILCEFYSTRHEDVSDRFGQMRTCLERIYPLELRLEVLENVFSMLFLRHEDFVEADSGSEEDFSENNAFNDSKKAKTPQKSEVGFFCNKCAIRELLGSLEKSLNRFKIELEKREKNGEGEEKLKRGLISISEASSDAKWRLELLMSSEFVRKAGTLDREGAGKISFSLPDDRINCSGLKSKTIFYNPDKSSSEDEVTRSDLDGSSEAGSQGNGTSNSGRRRKRMRRVSSSVEMRREERSERTLNCMLASKENLVLQCLWRGDYERATQVIEMFRLKKSRLEGEILFSKAMKAFRRDMRRRWITPDTVDSPLLDSKQTTLENIRRVVQEGFHSSRSTSHVETFLASQESSVRLLNSESTPAKNILALASLDLALTMSQTHQDSLNLAGVAVTYLQSSKKLSNIRNFDFFNEIHRSIYESDSESSIRRILQDARRPLCSRAARDKLEYWNRLSEKLRAFGLREKSEKPDSHLEEELFDEISNICANGELYLPRVHAHLKILCSLVPEEASETRRTDDFLLRTSLDSFIGDQIFGLNLDLLEVETVASRLRVNLVHSILVNCCPELRFTDEDPHRRNQKWGLTILNKTRDDSAMFDNSEPNQCVSEILKELMEVLQASSLPDFILRPEELRELARSERIRKILQKTQKIAKIDLSNLSFGNPTLSFFLNVCNILVLHAILDIWSSDPPVDELRHEMSLSSICYEIGDLGTVSLQALRSRLLGQSSRCSQVFPSTEELNEPAWQDLDVPNDPRVAFALINECEKSPVLRIYSSGGLNEELETSARDYLNFYKENDPQEATTRLSEAPNRDSDSISKKFDTSPSNRSKKSEKFTEGPQNPGEYPCEVAFAYSKRKPRKKMGLEGKSPSRTSWRTRVVKQSLLQYLEEHCWLLSYLVQRIHEESPTILESSCESAERTAAFENLVSSTWAQSLKPLFEDNKVVAGLRSSGVSENLWQHLQQLLSTGEASTCLEIIQALPDSVVNCSVEIQRLKDLILEYLASGSRESDFSDVPSLVYQIRNEQNLARLVLNPNHELPIHLRREIVSHALSHFEAMNLPDHCVEKIREVMCKVEVFRKMLPFCSEGEADEKFDFIDRNYRREPGKIVKRLLEANQFELCLEWLEFQASDTEIHSLITQELLVGLLKNQQEDFKHADKLLKVLSVKKSILLCKGVISKLEAIAPLKFVVGYLVEHCEGREKLRFQRTMIGVEILEKLEKKERKAYLHLTEEPLLMFEQLLMNCRLDCLQKIVQGIREEGQRGDIEKFDETVRFYASKSLDFRVAVLGGEMERLKDASVASNKSQGDFVMPLNVPRKDEWVPNDKASECSCCRVVIFTMFNRRHHCRRCGRVVCASCSPQRMRLPNYPNSVPVRVCNDCKRQMVLQLQVAQGAPSTPSSEAFECWRLTLDENYNKTLREEFSFENAPNISLCLAILNLHSDHEAYSNFLLDRCDDMKALLRPDSKGRVNPEVDHALIIKMIWSLLLAAKVKFAELGLNTGLTHCDRFLSQVDLINTLVNSDCSSLIPRTDEDDHLEDHVLRRLRDLLTEREQWIIALDVSTKTGLDTQGVWAAWGTACLKAGFYERAREKFAHCLDKVLKEDSEDWVLLSYPGENHKEKVKRSTEAPVGSHGRRSRQAEAEGASSGTQANKTGASTRENSSEGYKQSSEATGPGSGTFGWKSSEALHGSPEKAPEVEDSASRDPSTEKYKLSTKASRVSSGSYARKSGSSEVTEGFSGSHVRVSGNLNSSQGSSRDTSMDRYKSLSEASETSSPSYRKKSGYLEEGSPQSFEATTSSGDLFLECSSNTDLHDFSSSLTQKKPVDSQELPKNRMKDPHDSLKNRPNKDPHLLTEILAILDRMNPNDRYDHQNSKSRNKNAQEILNTLNSLKSISQGHMAPLQPVNNTESIRYQESLYYLLMYGSFSSILEFFLRHGEFDKCLAYVLENNVDPELFMGIFLRCLKTGCLADFCEAMRAKDASLVLFKKYLMYTCHSLQKKGLFNTLLHLQLFMKDFVRAAMTCIKFYISEASSYKDLCSRNHFLVEAQKHLESELQLENFGKKRRKSVSSSLSGQNSLTLEMEPAEIDRHINTISRQMEIAKFLGGREHEGRNVWEFMSKLVYMESEGSGSGRSVPTLFGNQQEKTHLAVLAILCGKDVEEGFGIAFRIMQDYNLRQQKIYSLVGHMLALDRNINSIEQLIKCCRSSGAPNSNAISDRVLAHCVKLLLDRSRNDSNPSPKDQIDLLIRIITDVELKIESYIESRQLKAAYLLAVKHSRAQDIRKILKEADRLGQVAIKSICTKWLQQTQGS